MKRRELLLLLGSAALLILLWIVFNVMHSRTTSKIEPAVRKELSPIAPTFDKNAIAALKKRSRITPIFGGGGLVVQQTSQSATPSQATSAGQTVATQGATLQGL